MTDEKDKDVNNVIYGPWGSEPVSNKYDKSTSNWIKQKYDRELDKNNSQLQMKEKLAKIDLLTENVMVQMIHTMSENGYDIADEQFILDVGFLSEVIKGALSRQEGLPHIIQGFIEQIMSPEKKETEDGEEGDAWSFRGTQLATCKICTTELHRNSCTATPG